MNTSWLTSLSSATRISTEWPSAARTRRIGQARARGAAVADGRGFAAALAVANDAFASPRG